MHLSARACPHSTPLITPPPLNPPNPPLHTHPSTLHPPLLCQGILSGTLSYIFNTYKAGAAFSSVVAAAKELGYTEPDPREDLSGGGQGGGPGGGMSGGLQGGQRGL